MMREIIIDTDGLVKRILLPATDADRKIERLEKVVEAAKSFIMDLESFMPGFAEEVASELTKALKEYCEVENEQGI
jgi:hypothetical protein